MEIMGKKQYENFHIIIFRNNNNKPKYHTQRILYYFQTFAKM